MGYFITAKSRIEQTNKPGYWKLIDNELYMSNDGRISVTPRYFWSDSYSFPTIITPILGDRNKLDVRPAHGHDLFCRFHQRLYIDLTLQQLTSRGYVHSHNDLVVCEDIPLEFLHAEIISKKYANDLIKEMILACGINSFTANLIRIGVALNLNWKNTGKKDIMSYNIFKEDIGLVNGF